MTSLFFIMLVLFVLIIIVLCNYHKQMTIELEKKNKELQNQNKELLEDKETIDKINELKDQFAELQKSSTFMYLPESQKFIARSLLGKEIFMSNDTIIQPEFVDECKQIGREIEDLLKKLAEYKQFKYQLVIEGNCANPKPGKGIDNHSTYVRSYKRALALYELWLSENIDLRKYNTEIIICGSGFNGEDRDRTEDNNKRFVIQIIPKIKPLNE